jgi:hypothetical protein
MSENQELIRPEVGVQMPETAETMPSSRPALAAVSVSKAWRRKKQPLTQERCLELFNYCPDTGVLERRISYYRNVVAGSIVDTLDSSGYYQVMVDGWTRMAHRVIWCLVHGYDTEHQIDHINRDKTDNRIENLREATHSCNIRNCGMRVTNKSGVKGVRWVKEYGRFIATITVAGRPRTLGWFHDFTEAVCHRYAAEQCLDWHSCDLDSSAGRYLKQQGIIK